MDGHEQVLDICGQNPGLGIYTQLCLCYPTADPPAHQHILEKLKYGLEKLASSFPWTAAQIVNEGASEVSSGVFKFRSLEVTPRLSVNDLRKNPTAASWESLKNANFPFQMLDEKLICPRNTIPNGTDDPISPVFLVQANFITNGLLLTFTSSHQAMDMTGHGQLMHLLNKACNGEAFTEDEISTGNLRRDTLVPFLEGPLLDLPFQDIKASAQPTSPPQPVQCTWAYFSFSATALSELKYVAGMGLTTGFVSTDDTITAFIWQSLARARSVRLGEESETTLARAIDPRRYLGIPATYAGIMQNMTYCKMPIGDLTQRPLGKTAQELRYAVDPKTSTLPQDTRVLYSKLHRSPLKNTTSVAATIKTSRDLMLSSWANQDSYDLDFGLGLGKPECVRRPQFIPVEGLAYLMPKRLDGEIALGICLRNEDLERLSSDELFLKYATPVL